MYRIREDLHREKYDLLLPSMLDTHYPLMKYMFWNRRYRPMLMDDEEDIANIGLKYMNNEMCQPIVLMAGEMIKELQKRSNPSNVALLMPTAGDACRGANYIPILRKAVKKAGFDNRVLTINVMGIDRDNQLNITPNMAIRAFFSTFYADILMILLQQTRPYEKNKGEANALWQKWVDELAGNLRDNRHLSFRRMYKNFDRIVDDFSKLERSSKKKKRIGLVGEVFAKYCHLGNYSVVDYLEKRDCETYTNGFSWYILYYLKSHMKDTKGPVRLGFIIAYKFIEGFQRKMIEAIRRKGFYVLDTLSELRKRSEEYVSDNLITGDGWLIGTEIVGMFTGECKHVLAIAPFGCMANVCCGRGLYPHLQRSFPEGMLVSVEPDISASTQNYFNRVNMLVDWKKK